jgi:8-oxo-dGTP pyrophosphatase MutT (NUDIX family)
MAVDGTKLRLRPAGRVIVVDPRNRILLIRTEDPSIDQPILWLTPGGACEADETAEQAAIRELWEETGIRVPTLGPLVWRRRHVWRWGERMVDSREDFFLCQCGDIDAVAPAAATEFEQQVIREFRWWSVSEMQQAQGEFFVPRRLPELLLSLLSGELPQVTLEIGA